MRGDVTTYYFYFLLIATSIPATTFAAACSHPLLATSTCTLLQGFPVPSPGQAGGCVRSLARWHPTNTLLLLASESQGGSRNSHGMSWEGPTGTGRQQTALGAGAQREPCAHRRALPA